MAFSSVLLFIQEIGFYSLYEFIFMQYTWVSICSFSVLLFMQEKGFYFLYVFLFYAWAMIAVIICVTVYAWVRTLFLLNVAVYAGVWILFLLIIDVHAWVKILFFLCVTIYAWVKIFLIFCVCCLGRNKDVNPSQWVRILFSLCIPVHTLVRILLFTCLLLCIIKNFAFSQWGSLTRSKNSLSIIIYNELLQYCTVFLIHLLCSGCCQLSAVSCQLEEVSAV